MKAVLKEKRAALVYNVEESSNIRVLVFDLKAYRKSKSTSVEELNNAYE